jgi:hypothetical protein
MTTLCIIVPAFGPNRRSLFLDGPAKLFGEAADDLDCLDAPVLCGFCYGPTGAGTPPSTLAARFTPSECGLPRLSERQGFSINHHEK